MADKGCESCLQATRHFTQNKDRYSQVYSLRLTLSKEYGGRTVLPQRQKEGGEEEDRYRVHVCVYVLYVGTYLCSSVRLICSCDFVNIHISVCLGWSQKQGAWGSLRS